MQEHITLIFQESWVNILSVSVKWNKRFACLYIDTLTQVNILYFRENIAGYIVDRTSLVYMKRKRQSTLLILAYGAERNMDRVRVIHHIFMGKEKIFPIHMEWTASPFLKELQFLMGYVTQSDRENLALLAKIPSAVWYFHVIG